MSASDLLSAQRAADVNVTPVTPGHLMFADDA
jgi:hypothetical protein